MNTQPFSRNVATAVGRATFGTEAMGKYHASTFVKYAIRHCVIVASSVSGSNVALTRIDASAPHADACRYAPDESVEQEPVPWD